MHDGDELAGWGAVSRVRGEVQECDLAVLVDDDVGAELQGVVTRVTLTRSPARTARRPAAATRGRSTQSGFGLRAPSAW